MKIEVIAKKNHSYQFSNIILRNYLFFFIRIFKENWKIFQNRLLFPSEHIFLRNDFDSAFYQGWFVLYTHVNYMHVYYIHRRHSILRAEDASHRDARNQLRLSCFLSVSSFLSFSCPLSSFSLFLYLSLSNAEDIWKRYSKIIFRRFFEQLCVIKTNLSN